MNKVIVNFKSYLNTLSLIEENVFNMALDFLELKKIKKGDYFLSEGAVCNHIAFIDTGLFRTFFLKDGEEINSCFCKENSIMSSFDSFVNQSISHEYIQALEDSTILSLSYDKLNKLAKISPQWESIRRLSTEKECMRLSNRITSISHETATQKYLTLMETEPEIIQRVSIQHIASYIGIAKETLSRIRSNI